MGTRRLALGCALLLTAALAPVARADELVHVPRGTIALPASLGARALSGVAVDGAGNVYAGARRSNGNSVAVFGSDGAHIRNIDIGSIKANSGRDGGHSEDELDLAIGPDGLLYVAQPIPNLGAQQDRYISVYTTSGSLVRELKPDDGGAKFWIGDLELDAAGNIFVLVRHNGPGFIRGGPVDEVLRIDRGDGKITARFPLAQEESSVAETELGGLALDPDGSIWVTTPLDGSRLIHLAADGGPRLASPKLDAIVDLKTRSVEDIDFAGGLLYVAAGRPNGMVAITPEGRLVDRIPGTARQLAVAGTTAYATKLGAGGTSARAAQSSDENLTVRRLVGKLAKPPSEISSVEQRGCDGSRVGSDPESNIVHMAFRRQSGGCTFSLINYSRPQCSSGPATAPRNVYAGGRELGRGPIRPVPAGGRATARFEFDLESVAGLEGDGGYIVIEWDCPIPAGEIVSSESVFEKKGSITLIDPSGNVLDRKTSRPIEFATVRLEFTPVRGGAFGTPSLSLMRPQVNPQITGPEGAFAWDVAPGFWRLRVSAFGYKPLTSATFEIPPEVTGLKLRLRRSSAYRRLIDPAAGSVGDIRVGSRLRRGVGGLRIGLRKGRVSEIVVRTKSFQTASGIKLRSTELDVLRAYPAAKQSGPVRRGRKVLRLKRAFFTTLKGRVVAIKLAR
jgi:sugar lactone lactonase YvrE